jgi:hypothetical protein
VKASRHSLIQNTDIITALSVETEENHENSEQLIFLPKYEAGMLSI